MKRLAMLSLGLAYAVVSTVSFLSVARDAPALSAELRSQNVYGDWRVPITSTLFHRGEYDFQIGFSLLQTDAALMLLDVENPPSVDVFARNMERAKTLFQHSLAKQPGHAATWSALFWVHASAGRTDEARYALEMSSKLAPFNRALAPDRLAAVESLDEIVGKSWIQSDFGQSNIARDLSTLQRFDAEYYRLLVEENRSLRNIAEQARLLAVDALNPD
ncbi:MAG: hypothetical protein AAGA71_06165 [Pseudomonadota bacterium]